MLRLVLLKVDRELLLQQWVTMLLVMYLVTILAMEREQIFQVLDAMFLALLEIGLYGQQL